MRAQSRAGTLHSCHRYGYTCRSTTTAACNIGSSPCDFNELSPFLSLPVSPPHISHISYAYAYNIRVCNSSSSACPPSCRVPIFVKASVSQLIQAVKGSDILYCCERSPRVSYVRKCVRPSTSKTTTEDSTKYVSAHKLEHSKYFT